MSNNPKSARQSHGTRNGAAGSQRYAQIIGWGMAVPDRIVTNDDLSRIVETTDEWIRSRTGIAERHIVSNPSETTATLATQAAREASPSAARADVPGPDALPQPEQEVTAGETLPV